MNTLPQQLLFDLPLRHARLQQAMANANADALLVTLNNNLIYTTGTVIRGWFYLPLNGTPLIFYRRPLDLPQRLPGFTTIQISRPDQITAALQDHNHPLPSRLLLEGDELPASEWFQFARIFTTTELLNGSTPIRLARAVKTPYELTLLRESCRRHAAVVATFPSLYRPGMSDLDLSIAMENASRQAGSLGLMRAFGGRMEIFMGSVLCGDNADTPAPYDFALGGAGLNPTIPIGPNNTPLRSGTTIMADVSGNFTGYISDCSRTYAIGSIPDHVREAHQLSIAICHAVAKAGTPGTNSNHSITSPSTSPLRPASPNTSWATPNKSNLSATASGSK